MEIPFRSQFDSQGTAFVMSFEVQNITGNFDGEISRLGIYATFKLSPYEDGQLQDLYPVILDLHGKLYRTNYSHENGAVLQPIADLPISLERSNIPYGFNLSFVFSSRYIQLLEEHRASQQAQDVQLQMQMWGVAAMVKPRASKSEVPKPFQPPSTEVMRFEKISTGTYDPMLRIERSAWIDRILPGLGHRHSVLIELPLIRTPSVPAAYQKAAEALDMARRAFDQEDYRGAVRYGREVLEHLGKISQDGQITSFCKEHLEPFVGETKAQSIDRSLNALRGIVNAGSHIDPKNPFVVDRAIAAYVIETLALNLRYISSVLG